MMWTQTLKQLVFVSTLVLWVAACQAKGPWVEVNGERFWVEIADDDQARARGLMFRDELPSDQGMLFLFRQEAPRAFWMKNTRIALDIIYLDGDLRVVDIIKNAKPCRSPRCPSYPSQRPAQYVLELNAHQADALALEVGQQILVGGIALPETRP